MGHLILIPFLFILFLGFIATLKTLNLYKIYKAPYLKIQFIFLILLNYSFFISMISQYMIINLFSITQIKGNIIPQLINFHISILLIYMAWLQKEAFYLVQKIKNAKKTDLFLKAIYLILIILHIVFLFVKKTIGNLSIFDVIVNLSILFFFLHTAYFALIALIKKHDFYKENQIKFIKRYSLTIFLIFIITFIDQLAFHFGLFNVSGITIFLLFFFSINLLSIVYIKKTVKIVFPQFFPQLNRTEFLKNLYTEYNISKREQEIVFLICTGKTNKEIGIDLSINYQTVKDHVYSIFKKTRVKNRVQLTQVFIGN